LGEFLEGSVKKLFVLFLCLVAVAGFVSAGAVHPPGASVLEMTGYGFHEAAVTPVTVLVIETPVESFYDQILVVPDLMVNRLPQIVLRLTVDNPVLPDVPVADVRYPLRL
jgi:hypothetical protein